MYYITNQQNQIIAFDKNLLALLEADSTEEFNRKMALREITLSKPLNGEVTVKTPFLEKAFEVETTLLSGVLGEMTLVQLVPLKTIEQEMEKVSEEETLTIEEKPEEIISIIEEAQEEISETVPETEAEEMFELLTPETEEVELLTEDVSGPINIDVETISRKIGVIPEDYNTFLDEYIDTALSLENDLQEEDDKKRNDAIDTLTHLSNVLHLPAITDIVMQIKYALPSDRKALIESFYTTLAKLTTQPIETVQVQESEATVVEAEEPVVEKKYKAIDLSDVKPIHFDFQIEEAAKELSLPVELIDEFVRDFIVQAHEETKKLLDAYEEGDLETMQKIGHLLKGTSSNLRITPLSDTLYEIQFCDDIEKMEGLIRNYWGHFLSFETQINLTSKK